jgi:hypothetical protein
MADHSAHPEPDDGQFDDAPDDSVLNAITPTPTANSANDLRNNEHAFIDDDAALLAWSDDEAEYLYNEGDEDELNEDDFDEARVEDEDWEMAERGQSLPLLRVHSTGRSSTPMFAQTSLNSTIVSASTLPFVPVMPKGLLSALHRQTHLGQRLWPLFRR